MNQNLITALFNVHDQIDTLYMYITVSTFSFLMLVCSLYPAEKLPLFLCFVFTFCPVKFMMLTDLVSPPGYLFDFDPILNFVVCSLVIA